MKIKGQKISIVRGESFPLTFTLVAKDGEPICKFEPSDTIMFVIQNTDGCDIIRKEITGVSGFSFDVFVDKNESRKLCEDNYEYGVYVINGNNRIALTEKPIPFIVERGV